MSKIKQRVSLSTIDEAKDYFVRRLQTFCEDKNHHRSIRLSEDECQRYADRYITYAFYNFHGLEKENNIATNIDLLAESLAEKRKREQENSSPRGDSKIKKTSFIRRSLSLSSSSIETTSFVSPMKRYTLSSYLNYVGTDVDGHQAYVNFNAHDRVFEAAKAGNLGFIRNLLTRYPNLLSTQDIARDPTNRTPLHWVVLSRNIDAFATLSAIGGMQAIGLRDVDGNTPVHLAAIQGNLELLAKTIVPIHAQEVVKIHTEDCANGKDTLFHCATRSGNQQVFKLFRDLPGLTFDIKTKGQNGQILLHDAVRGNCKDLIDEAIFHSSGDDPTLLFHATDSHGLMPMHYAAKYGLVDATRQLVERMIEFNGKPFENDDLEMFQRFAKKSGSPETMLIADGYKTFESLSKSEEHFQPHLLTIILKGMAALNNQERSELLRKSQQPETALGAFVTKYESSISIRTQADCQELLR